MNDGLTEEIQRNKTLYCVLNIKHA